jgi:hypothetical protein
MTLVYRVGEMLRALLALTVVMATFVCPMAATGVLSRCHADEAPMECCDHHQAAAPQDGTLALLGVRGAPLDPPAPLAELAPVPAVPLLVSSEHFAVRAPLHPPRSHDPDRLTVFRI